MLQKDQVTNGSRFENFSEEFISGIPLSIQFAPHVCRFVGSAFMTDQVALEEVLEIKPFLHRGRNVKTTNSYRNLIWYYISEFNSPPVQMTIDKSRCCLFSGQKKQVATPIANQCLFAFSSHPESQWCRISDDCSCAGCHCCRELQMISQPPMWYKSSRVRGQKGQTPWIHIPHLGFRFGVGY